MTDEGREEDSEKKSLEIISEDRELLESFFQIEKSRLDVEKMHETNIGKELETTGRSAEIAAKAAEKDADNIRSHDENVHKQRMAMIICIFILAVLFISGFGFLICYLSRSGNEEDIIEKLFAFIKDVIKIAGGFLVGYFIRRPVRNKS